MTDCETITLTISIPSHVHDRLMAITKAQNANLNNNISRLLSEGMNMTEEKYPNLMPNIDFNTADPDYEDHPNNPYNKP